MPRLYFLILPAIALLLTGCQTQPSESIESAKTLGIPDQPKIMGQLQLKSPDFLDQGQISSKYTCDGEDINPPLEISGVPEGAQTLALIVDDPDAPAGDWAHWLLWNIPVEVSKISENSAPLKAVQGKTDFNQNKYGGPCPPSGAHRYQFKLYALDSQLNLTLNTRKKNLEKAMQGHILDQVLLVGLYKRE
ncbi:MAG: YbhB/YbcL family Raf kinase inhibitor-like protein [Patescibacteria group bacterium]